MESSSPLEDKLKTLQTNRPSFDLFSGGVIVLMTVGLPILGLLHYKGMIPSWGTVIVGSILMNLSFTAWHEPSHGNLARSKIVNDIFGWVASFASVYPGYFARRREHLVHHKWQGQEGMDPVYPRIQTNFMNFPIKLLLANVVGKPSVGAPDTFLPLTMAQKWADAISNYLALGVVLVSIFFSFWSTVWWSWILPRIIIFMLHAYYICFFPHNIKEGGYQVFRVRETNWFIRFITVEQNLHGIHHFWPWIPWYRYREILPLDTEFLTENSFQVL
jgi:beta-carotene hydroxylase